MSNEEIRPTTVVGIKRLARSIKASSNLFLWQARDEAARRAGFENYRHALNRRPPAEPLRSPSHQRLYISGAWMDRRTGKFGCESAFVEVSAKWDELVTRPQMLAYGPLVRLYPAAEDHLSYRYAFTSQSEARSYICKAIRAFQFMDATRLRPTKAHSRVYPGGDSTNAIPGRDHSSVWYDPATKGYVFADEPYEPAALSNAAERARWAARYGYEIAKPAWLGMYNPGGQGGSRLYLIANRKKGPQVAALAAALDKLPPSMLEETWNGESISGPGRFQSPAEIRDAQDSEGSGPKPVSRARVVTPRVRSIAPRVREAQKPGKMPIEMHEELGRMLRTVLADTYHRDGVYKRVNSVRSELDDWIQREYPSEEELPNVRFVSVYYGNGPRSTFAKSISLDMASRHVETLEAVKSTLLRYYYQWDLKSMAAKIDAAEKSLQKWAS